MSVERRFIRNSGGADSVNLNDREADGVRGDSGNERPMSTAVPRRRPSRRDAEGGAKHDVAEKMTVLVQTR